MDKLKSAFFGTGPFGEVVEGATSELLLQPDWEKNIQICDQINLKLDNAKHAVRAIRRRTNSGNSKTQYLALVLLESCIKNCGMRFHREFSAYRDLQSDLIRIASVQARGQGEHMAQEQARQILLNLHHFARERRDLQPLAGLMQAAQQRGARFDGVRREDWAAQLGAVGAAAVQDVRNYHQEDVDARRRPQQPAPSGGQKAPPGGGAAAAGFPGAQAGGRPAPAGMSQLPPPPAGVPAGQPYVVQGPDGQRMLVQPLPPEQRPPQQQQAPPQHADPAARHSRPARQLPSPEEQAAQMQAEFQVVYDQMALMGEMLSVKEQEAAAPAAVLADEPVTALAESLRNAQSRVSHVIATGGGGDSIGQFLELNDALIASLEKYASLSGGVGVPASVPPPEIPPDTQQQPPPQQQAHDAGGAGDDMDADTLAAIRLSQMEADARAAEAGGAPAPEPPAPAQPAAQQTPQQRELDDIFGDSGAAPARASGGGDGEPQADDFADFALSRDRSRSEQQPATEPTDAPAPPPVQPPAAPPQAATMGTLPPPPPPAAAAAVPAAPLPVLPPPPAPQSSISPPPAGGAGSPPPAAELAPPQAPPAANPNAPAEEGGDDEDFDSFLNTKLSQQQDAIN